METLFRSFRTQLEHTSTEVVRFLHDQIAWDSRLVAILGARWCWEDYPIVAAYQIV